MKMNVDLFLRKNKRNLFSKLMVENYKKSNVSKSNFNSFKILKQYFPYMISVRKLCFQDIYFF